MKHYIKNTFESLFDFDGEGEKLYEVSAEYDYDNEVLDIEYVYDLETAQYVEINIMKHNRYWAFQEQVIHSLTRTGKTTDFGFFN